VIAASLFIHIEHLYSTPSRKPLKGASNSSMAIRNSLKVGTKHKIGEGDKAQLGGSFQVEGPTTEKAWFCSMEVRTRRRPCSDEL